jgi:GntR family transcriptional regulator, carbon starvation induced regulator
MRGRGAGAIDREGGSDVAAAPGWSAMTIQLPEIVDDLEDHEQSLTIQAYAKLRAAIISGELTPGQRLKVESLRDQMAVGATPLREALSLLTSERLVERIDKRGFRVTEISLAEYEDLHRTRCLLEQHALRESMALGDQSWEETIVLVHHRLRRLPRTIADERGARSNPDWERMHKRFHMSLLAASPSKTVLQFCDQLHDRINRYRSVAAVGSPGQRSWRDEHDAIAEAVINRDVEQAVGVLMQHYARTSQILQATLASRSAPPG